MKKRGRPRKVLSSLRGPHKYQWSKQQLEFLQANFENLTNRQLASELRLTLTLVRMKCYEIGLKRMELEYWTPEQVLFLKKSYRKFGDIELAEIFGSKWHKDKGWTNKHIEKKRKYLDLRRSEEERHRIFLRNKQMGRFRFCVVNRWITQGVSPEGTIRIWKATAKNGHHSYFKVIKTGGAYVHYARWLYEKHNGKIHSDMVIGYKDRDNMNVIIENLEIITRAEHARRNGRRLPEDLRESIKLLNSLSTLINEKQNEKGTN